MIATSRLRVLLEKEWMELSRHRTLVATIVIPPIIFLALPFVLALVTPAMIGKEAFEDPNLNSALQIIRDQAGGASHLQLRETFQVLIFRQFILFFLLIPVISAMSITAYSIVGEKVNRSLEPLLATPITTAELLWAKCLAAMIPTVLLSWISFLLFGILIVVVCSPMILWAVITPTTICLILLFSPAVGMLALSLCLVTSSRSSDPRSAQQISVVIILPVVGLFISQLKGALTLTPMLVIMGTVLLLIVDYAVLKFGTRLFERETILTRWK